MAVENICNFFKYGYCKFKMSCKNKHVTLVCDDDKCNPQKCEKRHPRLCKYISNYGSCKLGSICAYSHKDHNRKNENKRLEKKLDELIAMVNKREGHQKSQTQLLLREYLSKYCISRSEVKQTLRTRKKEKMRGKKIKMLKNFTFPFQICI